MHPGRALALLAARAVQAHDPLVIHQRKATLSHQTNLMPLKEQTDTHITALDSTCSHTSRIILATERSCWQLLDMHFKLHTEVTQLFQWKLSYKFYNVGVLTVEKEHSKFLIYIQLSSVVSHFCYRPASYRPQHDFTSPATHATK